MKWISPLWPALNLATYEGLKKARMSGCSKCFIPQVGDSETIFRKKIPWTFLWRVHGLRGPLILWSLLSAAHDPDRRWGKGWVVVVWWGGWACWKTIQWVYLGLSLWNSGQQRISFMIYILSCSFAFLYSVCLCRWVSFCHAHKLDFNFFTTNYKQAFDVMAEEPIIRLPSVMSNCWSSFWLNFLASNNN